MTDVQMIVLAVVLWVVIGVGFGVAAYRRRVVFQAELRAHAHPANERWGCAAR